VTEKGRVGNNSEKAMMLMSWVLAWLWGEDGKGPHRLGCSVVIQNVALVHFDVLVRAI